MLEIVAGVSISLLSKYGPKDLLLMAYSPLSPLFIG
jgi:hypothetical protein